ncbi:zinc finger protein 471-like isoform X2 [Cryptotermes secundus]|uniref:zinc finger protein 471-like isoform X2 n=1 Tax=Cryptotermes secundus TaxID=105785 RepID=UPI000CD7B3AA|nr:zinc finger protein 471-like isoform X2 [Cryptotermes secundus]
MEHETVCVPSVKLEIDKEVAFGDSETLRDDKDGIFRFPSCLIQDSPCIKEEVKDEITVEEGGVNCEIEEGSKTHSQCQSATSDWPIKVDLDEDLISQERKNACVKEMGVISMGSYIQQQRDPISTKCDVPMHLQNLYVNQNNTSDSFIDKSEEMSACTRKAVRTRRIYGCQFCIKTFSYPSDLDLHTRMIHTKCRSKVCEAELKRSSEQGKVHECRNCCKQTYGLFKNFSRCNNHVEPYSAHKIRCKSCGESYSRCYFSKVCCRSGRDMTKIDSKMRDFYFF